jgi:hypothetical protein
MMAYTFDTPLGTIFDDPKARNVIDTYIPGASGNPMLGMVKGWTLNTILSMPQATSMGLTREKAKSLLAEINRMVG